MHAAIVVGFATIGAVLFGFDQGNWAGAIVKPDFLEAFCVSRGYGTESVCGDPDKQPNEFNTFLSLGSSLIQLGAASGALFLAPLICGRLGRREAMFFGSWVAVAGIVPQGIVRRPDLFLAARFVAGIGVGVVTYALPVFISEVSPANIRGALGSLFQLVMVAGMLVASALNLDAHLPYKYPFLLPALPATVLAIGIFFFPMSPRFALIKYWRRGRVDEGVAQARTVLRRLRGSDEVAEAELSELRNCLASMETCVPWSRLWNDRSIRWRIFLANMLQLLQQLTGINAILSYGPSIFTAADVPVHPLLGSFITNLCNLFGTLVLTCTIDRFGRRKLLLSGAASMFLFMAVAAALSYAVRDYPNDDSHDAALNVIGWGIFFCVCSYMISFAVAWGGVPWVYPSEIFPLDVKEKAISTSVTTQWIANFGIAYFVPLQVKLFHTYGTFAIYSVCLGLCLIFVYFCIPETRGVALEDMGRLFGAESIQQSVRSVSGVGTSIATAGWNTSACVLPVLRQSSPPELPARQNLTESDVSLIIRPFRTLCLSRTGSVRLD